MTYRVRDQIENLVILPALPVRIISLVPSQTELLYTLGLDIEVVGITKFCVHPSAWFKSKERIGGTKTLDIKKIRSLKPDLIIANKEENEQQQILALQKEFPVWTSDIQNLEDALAMILSIGTIVAKELAANALCANIKLEFNTLSSLKPTKTVAYLIWKSPYMCASQGTFIDDMLLRCGLVNIFADATNRYVSTTLEEIVSKKPDYVFLSSEPFPFKKADLTQFQQLLANSMVRLVDGEAFSWYGSRLLQSPAYFNQILKEE